MPDGVPPRSLRGERTAATFAASIARGGLLRTASWVHTEIASVAGRTRIRFRTARLTDGKLASERFEGELDSAAYQRMAAEAQAEFVEKMRAD